MSKKVVTMGEMMLRLMPKGNLRLEQATSFDAYYGGDESIVAVSLAKFGFHSVFASKLPDNPLGRTAAKLVEQGVDTSQIAWGGERFGLNFYESGASVRPSRVLYDRKYSAISQANAADFDFESIFCAADWFHVSGITPAISDAAAKLTEDAMKAAKKHSVTVSMDLNYRSKLWSPEKAQSVMIPLMQYVDVCIGGIEDAQKVLGMPCTSKDMDRGEIDIEAYKDMFQQLKHTFQFQYIATTLRRSISASVNDWSSLIYHENEFFHTPKYQIHIVDRGGGGASFSAGVIYGILNGFNLETIGRFATAASALKQTIPGDFNLVTADEVFALMNGDGSGRIQR